ncbi:GNAT family N-acetyltransferase [Lentzea sp. BCCO 10_0798]|uniref:GNAT family N-acetyltransferase n=1 Tax=Lentzea kristufekii TaxID=3095430 RepID=A0ABU4U2B1_9PSEU|nr:GNAT family N-acetyltransferase [Lentzea sp. BCCO 10_0798]MDX8054525.1 GNAT family N-acetyltransferase [Lentzea sp. BCCO 10_0798]
MGENEEFSRVYAEPDDFAQWTELDRYATATWYDGRVLAVQDFGTTIRVVLPISLDTGHTVLFEVWVVVDFDEGSELGAELEAGGWSGATAKGLLLNVVEPWPEVYGAPVTFAGRPGEWLPRITGSEQPVLRRVLTEKWPVSVLALGRFWFENRVRPSAPGNSVKPVTDASALLSAFDTQARSAEWEVYPDAVQDSEVFRVAWAHRRGFVAGPPDLRLDGAELDAVIARQRDFFAARGQAVEWKTWGHDRPADLPERLEAAGFVSEGRETVLVGLAEEMAGPVQLEDGIVLRETKEEADLHRLAATATEVFGRNSSWLVDYLLEKQDDPNTVVVVAEADGQVVSSARLEIVPGTEFGGLWGGGTLAAWRGKGIYRALVAHRARVAIERGVKYLQVDASEDSRPILERLGFVVVTTTTGYVWEPSRMPW